MKSNETGFVIKINNLRLMKAFTKLWLFIKVQDLKLDELKAESPMWKFYQPKENFSAILLEHTT